MFTVQLKNQKKKSVKTDKKKCCFINSVKNYYFFVLSEKQAIQTLAAPSPLLFIPHYAYYIPFSLHSWHSNTLFSLISTSKTERKMRERRGSRAEWSRAENAYLQSSKHRVYPISIGRKRIWSWREIENEVIECLRV